MISISVIIPAFNEEKTIIEILEKIHGVRKNANLEIIIIHFCCVFFKFENFELLF